MGYRQENGWQPRNRENKEKNTCCEKEIVELLSKKRRMISSLNDFLYSEFAEQQPNDDDWGNTFNIE